FDGIYVIRTGEPPSRIGSAAVVRAYKQLKVNHAISVHRHPDTAETRDAVHNFLEPASNYTFEARKQEPLPT
ncbi:MAG: hypothetical protein ACLP8S_02515, partial [Solirubrobacteraceae bacterium]